MSTQPAQHPRTCQRCAGTGWQPGPPIPYTAGGVPGTYSTVEPCTHHWTDDDPTYDDEPRQPTWRWRTRWPDECDPDWGDIADDHGQRISDGEVEWDARQDADWREDVEHNLHLEPPRRDAP